MDNELKQIMKTTYEQKKNISKGAKITERTTRIVDLKNTITELKSHARVSTTDSNRQEKELANLKRCHSKLTRLRSKKKKRKRKVNRAYGS